MYSEHDGYSSFKINIRVPETLRICSACIILCDEVAYDMRGPLLCEEIEIKLKNPSVFICHVTQSTKHQVTEETMEMYNILLH